VAEALVLAAIAQRDEAAADLDASEQLASRDGIARRELERKRTGLRTAEAQLEQAEANRAQAEAQRDQFDPERAGTSLLPLRAAVDDARAALVVAETELAITEIRAPVAGRVLTVTTRAGQYAAVGGSGDPLVTLAPVGPLQVRAEVEEADLPLLLDGSAATGFPRGAGPDAGVPLTFLRREPLLKPKTTLAGGTAERIDTRVIEVVFEVTRDDAGLVPGQLLDVLIDTVP
ncbi:MAG: HlyD family secretion protein, partial [Devosia sp.]